MGVNDTQVSRRDVLRAATGAAATAGSAGLAAAGPDEQIRVSVGYHGRSGRRAALAAANDVVHDFTFDAVTVRLAPAAADALDARGDLRYVEEEVPGHVHAQSLPWGIDRVDADVVLDRGDTGDGAHVAILDTGIDSDHPDLAAALGAGNAVEDCDFCPEPWGDDHGLGHGTHVAGIAGAVDNSEGVVGTGAGVTLHAVKVCDSQGSCLPGDVAAGLDWVSNQGYAVANMSLGYDSTRSVLADAVDAAATADVVLVASTGNDACSDCVEYPASDSKVIAVTATDPDDNVTGYSNTGPEVTLTAPGGANDGNSSTSIRSTVRGGGYDTLWGTSMASPHVAGAAGLYRAQGMSKSEAESRLLFDAEDVGHSAAEQGHGLLDVFEGFPYLEVHTDSAFAEATTATLRGDLVDLALADSGEVYFEYGPPTEGFIYESSRETRTDEGLFQIDVGTQADTTYDYRAVVELADGSVDRGGPRRFHTKDSDGGGGRA